MTEKDVEIVRALLQEVKPHQIYVAGDLADPHGTHKKCTDAVLAAIDEEKKTASVYLKPDQVSLAIGKGGLNIRLSKMLTGYDIDVYREIEEEDVALTEFADEIDGWVIDALKACGCDTAKSVLTLEVEELVKRTDLEEETIKEVIRILKSEFE